MDHYVGYTVICRTAVFQSDLLGSVPLAIFTVVLARHEPAILPDRCVICCADHPGSSTRVIARDNMNGRLLWAGWLSGRVPCCPVCGVRLQLWRAWDFCRTLVIAGVSFAFGMVYLLPRLEGWATGLIVLSGYAP